VAPQQRNGRNNRRNPMPSEKGREHAKIRKSDGPGKYKPRERGENPKDKADERKKPRYAKSLAETSDKKKTRGT